MPKATTKKRTAKIEVFPSPRQPAESVQHFFRLRAANGEIIAQSEGYSTKGNARKAALAVKTAIATAPIVDVDE